MVLSRAAALSPLTASDTRYRRAARIRALSATLGAMIGALGTMAALADGPPHQNVEFSLDSGVSYDSNPNFASKSTEGAESAYTGGSLFLNENTPRLKALLGATAGYTKTVGATDYGYLLASVNARGEYAIVPGVFYWTGSENFGQNTTNAFAGPSHNNLNNVSLFSTGPQFIVPINDDYHVNMGGSFGESHYAGQSGQDNNRLGFNVALTHPIERYQSLSLQGTYSKLSYPNAASNMAGQSSGYSIENVFFAWSEGSLRNDMTVDLGEGRVTQGSLQYNSPTFRVNLNRLVSPHLNLGLVAEEEYSDTAQQISNSLITNRAPFSGSNPNSPAAANEQLIAQPLKTEKLSFSAKYVANRTQFIGGASVARVHYLENSTTDSTSSDLSGRIIRRLTFKTDLSFSAGIARVSYPGSSLAQVTENIGPSLAYRLTPSLILSGDVNYERRTSSLLQYGFSDYRISIGLRWSPFHNSGTFDQAPSSFSGVGGSGMQNIFTVPGSSY